MGLARIYAGRISPWQTIRHGVGQLPVQAVHGVLMPVQLVDVGLLKSEDTPLQIDVLKTEPIFLQLIEHRIDINEHVLVQLTGELRYLAIDDAFLANRLGHKIQHPLGTPVIAH
jgi:hypothetical protein